MTYEEARQLATTLYWTATSQHDVDDNQWRVLFNAYNKKYWNDIAAASGSLYARDTADLQTDFAGMLDYSGALTYQNDLAPAQYLNISAAGGWTIGSPVVPTTGFFAPDGSNTAWEISGKVGASGASLAKTDPPWTFPNGTDCVYAKAGSANFLMLSADSGTTWSYFNLATGTVGTLAANATAKISPFPQPGFGIPVGTTSAPTPTVSSNGWYKCSIAPVAGGQANGIFLNVATADGGVATQSGTIFVWGPRQAYADNMIDPYGVHAPLTCELKFLGRYISLDYEIPQDRYIYNIAFGQVQVLIPTAWTIMGEKITLLPRVSGPQTVRLTYVPRVGEFLQDTQSFLNGYLPQFHQLIVYDVVSSMIRNKPGADIRPITEALMDMKTQLKSYMRTRQRQAGRKIRFIPYE